MGPFTQLASLPASPGTLATVSYTDNTAVAGTQYFYFAQAFNGTTSSSDSNVASATTPTTAGGGTGGGGTGTPNPGGVPNGPFGLSVAATAPTTVQLSFVDNSNNETGFVVQRSTAGGAFTTLATLAAAAGVDSTVSYTDSTAAAGTSYSYTVNAVNGPYQSSTAGPVSVTTPTTAGGSTPPGGGGVTNPGGPPNGPYALLLGATGPNSVQISFVDNSSNETGFVIERATGASGPFTQVATLPPASGVHSTVTYTDSTDAPATTYFYRAYAVNGIYQSSIAGPMSVTTPAGSTVTIPNAPSGLSVTDASTSQIPQVLVSFTDNATNESGLVIQRSTNASGPFATVTTLPGDVGTGMRTYTDTGVSAGTTYYYQVYAENSAGSSTIDGPLSVTTAASSTGSGGTTNPGGPPNGPYGIDANAINSNSVQLTFIDNASNETGFVILRSSSAAGPFTQVGTASASPGTRGIVTFIDASVSPSSTYYYEAYAVNGPYASSVAGPTKTTTPALNATPTPTGPWVPYATLIGQAQETTDFPTINGTGVTVAVIDRGVDPNAPGLSPSKIIGGYNFRDNDTNTLDDNGHGTGVAGIIAASGYTYNGQYNQGVATDASLVVLKQESSENIKAALDWVIANAKQYNIQVINLTDFLTEVLPGAWDPTVYLSELQTIWNMGIFICSPVGNGEVQYGNVPIGYPSLSPYVVGVGGIDLNGNLYADSLRGNGLDVLGPADDVTMPYYIRNPNSVGYDQYDDNYDGTTAVVNYAIGTSWASAYVAGTAALIKQVNSKITPAEIQTILEQTGTPTYDPTDNIYVPAINVDKAVAMAEQLYGPSGTSTP
jgi:hypothetical protein